MRTDTFIKKLKEIEDYGMQKFWDDTYDGACPCFSGEKTIDGKKVKVWGRCWRVSDNRQDLIMYAEDRKLLKVIAKEVKRALDAQKWYNPYTLIVKDF